MNVPSGIAIITAALLCVGCSAPATGPHDSSMHHAGMARGAGAAGATPQPDARQRVTFPDRLREHTLANMRDHLLALGEIQEALGMGGFDRAADIAERRLGMSSLALHGAHDVAQFMPRGMQQAGTAMHRAASRFAVVARDASVSGDLRPALASLAQVNATCVACHAAYRLH